jgi:hypothetical protein
VKGGPSEKCAASQPSNPPETEKRHEVGFSSSQIHPIVPEDRGRWLIRPVGVSDIVRCMYEVYQSR